MHSVQAKDTEQRWLFLRLEQWESPLWGLGPCWTLHLGRVCISRATGLQAPVVQVSHCSRALLRGGMGLNMPLGLQSAAMTIG